MKKTVYNLLRALGLTLTLLPAMLVFAGAISFEMHKNLMLIGCLLWFVAVLSGPGVQERT